MIHVTNQIIILKRICSFFFLTFFLACIAFGQSGKTLSMHYSILNLIDSSAVAFAHVRVDGTSIGTVSNIEGEFILHVNDSVMEQNIIISCIGYKTKSIKISDLISSANPIYLAVDVVFLNEVIILGSKEDTIGVFLNKVIEKVKYNYPQDDFFLQGFFRQISQNADSASRLVEAAIDIQDPGYSKNKEKIRIRVNAFRKSNDYINYSWTISLVKLFSGTVNQLIENYSIDFIRSERKLIKEKSILGYILRLDSIIGKDGDKIACISYNSDPNKSGPYFIGTIFVNLADLAIVRMEYAWAAHPTFKFPRQDLVFYQGKYRFKHRVEYQKVGSKYYPLLISVFEPVDGVTGDFNKLQYRESTILINQIFSNKKEYSKIRRRETELADTDIYEKKMPYDIEFWSTYNIVLVNPLKNKDRFSLEFEESLDTQFRKNGSKRK